MNRVNIAYKEKQYMREKKYNSELIKYEKKKLMKNISKISLKF